MASAKVPGNFSSHSFRIEADTVAAYNEVPDHSIQSTRMGCWSSNASQFYIRMPAEVLAALSKKLAWRGSWSVYGTFLALIFGSHSIMSLGQLLRTCQLL